MKKLFIDAKYKGTIKVKNIGKLPDKIGLVTTVQFLKNLNEVKKQLKRKTITAGQILGCNVSKAKKIKNKVDAFLYIGTGNFHPIILGLLEKDVFILNPFTGNINKLEKKVIGDYKKRKKTAFIKFLNAKNVGVIISTKKQKFGDLKKYKEKKFYFFVADNINVNEFENFPFIEAWVNTACPRLEEDYNLVNIGDLE